MKGSKMKHVYSRNKITPQMQEVLEGYAEENIISLMLEKQYKKLKEKAKEENIKGTITILMELEEERWS